MRRKDAFVRSICFIPVAAVAALLLFGGAGKAKYTIKFGTVAPPDTPWAKQLEEIKERVERESGGRIRFRLYLGGQLGGEIEMVRQLRRGRIQGGGFSTGAVADIVPELSILELPYLFRDEQEADKILDEVAFEPLSRKLAEKGFYLAYWGENGWRSFGTIDRPIRKPEDLAGMKMRVQENPVHIEMYKALGATAIPLPVVEVIGALQTGLVHGFDNTPLFSVASEWIYKVKYYTLTRHIYQPAAILLNKRFWDRLPPDLQKILIGDRKREVERGRAGVRAMTPELLQIIRDAGIEVVTPTEEELKVFRERTRSVHEAFAAKMGPFTQELLRKIYAAQGRR